MGSLPADHTLFEVDLCLGYKPGAKPIAIMGLLRL